MVVHYGVNEDMAIQIYEEECKKFELPDMNDQPQLTSEEIAELSGIVCKMCDSTSTGKGNG